MTIGSGTRRIYEKRDLEPMNLYGAGSGTDESMRSVKLPDLTRIARGRESIVDRSEYPEVSAGAFAKEEASRGRKAL